jgi:predicted urease superfamily metal-dependent hydrolase
MADEQGFAYSSTVKVLLLRKLETSKYDTEKDFIRDNERANAILQSHRDTARTRIVARKISERNNATDWNKDIMKDIHITMYTKGQLPQLRDG